MLETRDALLFYNFESNEALNIGERDYRLIIMSIFYKN